MIKFLTFDNSFSPLRHRMTIAITFTFSRQNDVGSHARATQYWENVVLAVVLDLESKIKRGTEKKPKKKTKTKQKKVTEANLSPSPINNFMSNFLLCSTF